LKGDKEIEVIFMNSVIFKRRLRPLTAIVLFSFLLVLLAACGDSSVTATPAPPSNTSGATTTAQTAASTTQAATTAVDTTAPGATSANTTAPATATTPATSTTTPSASSGTGTGTTAKSKKALDTARGTVDSFDSSAGTLAVKETNGQTADFNTAKATIVGVSKLSLADFSQLSLTNKTVEFSALPGSDGSYTPTALTVLDQPAMPNAAKGSKANATKTKKAGATGNAMPTPAATAGTAAADRVVLHNVTVSGNTLTGTSASGTSVTVNLNDTTTLNQRVDEKPSDLAAGEKLAVDYRPQGKKATGPANAVAIVIEK
jgi:hypothetical protein